MALESLVNLAVNVYEDIQKRPKDYLYLASFITMGYVTVKWGLPYLLRDVLKIKPVSLDVFDKDE